MEDITLSDQQFEKCTDFSAMLKSLEIGAHRASVPCTRNSFKIKSGTHALFVFHLEIFSLISDTVNGLSRHENDGLCVLSQSCVFEMNFYNRYNHYVD